MYDIYIEMKLLLLLLLNITDFIGEVREALSGFPSHLRLVLLEAADDILQSGRAKEVLLLETQLLPFKHLQRVKQLEWDTIYKYRAYLHYHWDKGHE